MGQPLEVRVLFRPLGLNVLPPSGFLKRFFIFSLLFRFYLFVSGSNSAVECNLAKVEVEGSNPFSRSIFKKRREKGFEESPDTLSI